MTADAGETDFLRRWSRLKTKARSQEARSSGAPNGEAQQPPSVQTPLIQEPGKGEMPVLPPVESLDIESDYRPFFHPKIEESVRRAALKKLFSDPHFNVMDGLDVYIDDYSKSDPLPAGMLEQLEQAKKILAWSREDAEERAKAEARDRVAGAAAADPATRPLPNDAVEPPQVQAVADDATVNAAGDVNPAPRVE